MAQASLDKDQRRSFRDEAIRGLNSIATEVAIDRVSTRAGSDVVQKFFKKLHAQVTADSLEALRAERTKWVNHGGCERPKKKESTDQHLCTKEGLDRTHTCMA